MSERTREAMTRTNQSVILHRASGDGVLGYTLRRRMLMCRGGEWGVGYQGVLWQLSCVLARLSASYRIGYSVHVGSSFSAATLRYPARNENREWLFCIMVDGAGRVCYVAIGSNSTHLQEKCNGGVVYPSFRRSLWKYFCACDRT
eukprot:1837887-Rhodomonas_salina.2